ncbi:MAG: hypothetical protein M0Z99_34815 [Betaproteobacteria bacterium]|nr:hypothetical protein [Betaproteobacteria bacterium]
MNKITLNDVALNIIKKRHASFSSLFSDLCSAGLLRMPAAHPPESPALVSVHEDLTSALMDALATARDIGLMRPEAPYYTGTKNFNLQILRVGNDADTVESLQARARLAKSKAAAGRLSVSGGRLFIVRTVQFGFEDDEFGFDAGRGTHSLEDLVEGLEVDNNEFDCVSSSVDPERFEIKGGQTRWLEWALCDAKSVLERARATR